MASYDSINFEFLLQDFIDRRLVPALDGVFLSRLVSMPEDMWNPDIMLREYKDVSDIMFKHHISDSKLKYNDETLVEAAIIHMCFKRILLNKGIKLDHKTLRSSPRETTFSYVCNADNVEPEIIINEISKHITVNVVPINDLLGKVFQPLPITELFHEGTNPDRKKSSVHVVVGFSDILTYKLLDDSLGLKIKHLLKQAILGHIIETLYSSHFGREIYKTEVIVAFLKNYRIIEGA